MPKNVPLQTEQQSYVSHKHDLPMVSKQSRRQHILKRKKKRKKEAGSRYKVIAY